MLVIFTITETTYFGIGLYIDLMRLFRIYICGTKLYGCAVCPGFGRVMRVSMSCPKLIGHSSVFQPWCYGGTPRKHSSGSRNPCATIQSSYAKNI